jgi:hypothetical protein
VTCLTPESAAVPSAPVTGGATREPVQAFRRLRLLLKTADEMRAVDGSGIWAEGCRNTLAIAERVDPSGMFEYLASRSPRARPTSPGSERRFPDGEIVTVGRPVSGLRRKVTKKGGSWALTTLEDLEGAIELMISSSAYQLCSTLLAEDAILVVKARLDKREDTPKLIAMEDPARPDGQRHRTPAHGLAPGRPGHPPVAQHPACLT